MALWLSRLIGFPLLALVLVACGSDGPTGPSVVVNCEDDNAVAGVRCPDPEPVPVATVPE